MQKIKHTLCKTCDYYVIDGNKSYCEHDHWTNVMVEQSKLFNPLMFECLDYEGSNRQKNILFDVK